MPSWKHLVDMVRDGRQNGFVREFGTMGFDYARANPSYGLIFNKAMSSMSSLTTDWTVTAWHKSHALTFAMYATLGAVMAILGAHF